MPTSDARYAVPRRTALATTLAVTPLALVATACRWTPPWQDEDEPVVVDAVEGDSVLVAGVVERIRAARTQAAALLEGTPATSGTVRQWVALHDTHLTALGGTVAPGDPTATGTTPPAKVTKGTSLARLRSTEVALQKALAAQALEAESGQLAQSLASMASAIAQLLAVPAKVSR